MPNWCECDLTIHGPAGEMDECLDFVRGPKLLLDFNRVVPHPQHFPVPGDAERI
jgi:hypothetical protein